MNKQITNSHTPHLDRYIQKNVTIQMQEMDEQILANVIKSLLLTEEEHPENMN